MSSNNKPLTEYSEEEKAKYIRRLHKEDISAWTKYQRINNLYRDKPAKIRKLIREVFFRYEKNKPWKNYSAKPKKYKFAKRPNRKKKSPA